MQSDLKTNCVGRRPLICLFAESLPTQVLPQHLANYDFVCVKKNDNLFEVLEDRMPDVFISFKPTQPQEEMETLPLLVRRMWFEFDQLSPKIFAKIYNILCKRQLKCYLVRNSKDVSLNNGMIEVITPQAFLAHHTNQLEINFEFCFFLDKGLEKDPHMQTFYKKIWPNLSRLRGFCRARYHKLANPFVSCNANQLIFAAFAHMEPLMLQPFVLQAIE